MSRLLALSLAGGIWWGLRAQQAMPGFDAFIATLWAGSHAFLTVIAARLTILVLLLSALNVTPVILLGVSFPLNGLVTVLFWSLWFIDPALVFHSRKATIPLGINLAIHFLPLAASLWLIRKRRLTRTRVVSITLFAFCLVYLGLLHWLQTQDGRWLYPVLGIVSLPWQLALLSLSYAAMLLLYLLVSH